MGNFRRAIVHSVMPAGGKKTPYTFLCRVILLAATAVLIPSSLLAKEPGRLKVSRGHNVSVEAIQAFFDREVPPLLSENHIAGCTIGLANRDGTIFLKGYGYADLASKRTVDPKKTLFRAGSISKLFVWTAIMQLRDQGKLHLYDPVNRYLDFSIPATFPESIRIVDLMNHTPGFEDRLIGLFVQDPKLERSLRDVVRDVPKRIRPPGREIAYSNYGTMLAGYIVERLSGMPFDDYVQKKILEPLAMEHTTFHQKLSGQWRENLATGYNFNGKDFTSEPFEIVQGAPAGAVSTTAADMLRFMRAYLRGGSLDGKRILRESTVAEMRKATFRQDPRGNGFAHGFMELSRGEHPILGHGGDTIYFHSLSGYFPKDDLVFFLSTNTSTGSMLVYRLKEKFLQHFFPVPSGREIQEHGLPGTNRGMENGYSEYGGFYITNRRSESDPTRLISLILYAYVKPTSDGILVSDMLQRKLTKYVEVERDIFQKARGRERLLFLRDKSGRVDGILANEMAVMLFKRAPFYENPVVNLIVVLAGILFLATAFVFPPLGLIHLVRRFRSAGKLERYTIASGLILILLQFTQFGMFAMASKENVIFHSFGPASVWPLFVAALFLPVVAAFALYSWVRPFWKIAPRIHFLLFAISQLGLFSFYAYWKFFFI